MANNNENETAGEATEENESSINDLREAKIEITQHLFQNILNKCGDEYHKLKGFKKFIEAQQQCEGNIDTFVSDFQNDMKKHNIQRNSMLKFALEKMANAELQSEQDSIAKINEFQKIQK